MHMRWAEWDDSSPHTHTQTQSSDQVHRHTYIAFYKMIQHAPVVACTNRTRMHHADSVQSSIPILHPIIIQQYFSIHATPYIIMYHVYQYQYSMALTFTFTKKKHLNDLKLCLILTFLYNYYISYIYIYIYDLIFLLIYFIYSFIHFLN